MKIKMKMNILKLIIIFLCSSTATISCLGSDRIVCDKFKILYRLNGNLLELSLNTDLPDHIALTVSVSRSCFEKVSAKEFSFAYFSKKSTVGQWKDPRQISLDNKNWLSALKVKQKEMASVGLEFDLEQITDKIKIYMAVPHQEGLGKNNENLTGTLVNKDRTVSEEVYLKYPL